MGARWPLAQGGRVGRAGESSAFCPPTQPCRKLVVFFWGRGEVRGAHLLSGAEARSSSPVEKNKKNSTARARGHKRANTRGGEFKNEDSGREVPGGALEMEQQR